MANAGYLLTVNALGNLDFATTVTGAGGFTKNGPGTVTFGGSASNLYTGATVVNAGTLLLSKPLSPSIWAITGAGVTVNQGATLAGTGTIDTSVTNNGAVSPGGTGSVGTLDIIGNYTQTGTGSLNMELASATSYDQVMISGVATLAGALDVSFLNGYQPQPGAKFTIMTFASHTGKFGTVNLPPGWSIIYNSTTVVIEAALS